MSVLGELEPKKVFQYFETICGIPHGSGNTGPIADYLVKFAQDRGATIVAITDNMLSPVYQLSDAALLAPCEMISFVDSMVAPLSLMNALLIAVGARMRADVSRTFAELEDIWNAYGVFGKVDDE